MLSVCRFDAFMAILLLNNYSQAIPFIDVFLAFIDKMIIFVVNNLSNFE